MENLYWQKYGAKAEKKVEHTEGFDKLDKMDLHETFDLFQRSLVDNVPVIVIICYVTIKSVHRAKIEYIYYFYCSCLPTTVE